MRPVKTARGTKEADLAAALIITKAKTLARARRPDYHGAYTFGPAAQCIESTRTP